MKQFKKLILLTTLIPLLSCNYSRTSFIEPLDSIINAKELLSIEITSSSNPILPADGLTEIHDDRITIYLSPDINSDSDSLILDINAQGYEYFTLNNQRVESGETPVIFGHDSPKTFSIHSQDGSQRDFEIRVVETLVTQLYSYDPRSTAPLQDSYYNGNVPFYLECNTSIDESSLEAGDFTLSSDYSIGTINRITENLYMLLIDSVSTVPRVDQISIELPMGAIMDDDGSGNPVTNRNYSHSTQNWDSLPPAFSGSIPAELIYEGNQRMDFRLYPWIDSISAGSELKYSLYYSESSAANTTDAPAYSIADLDGQIPVHSDLNISGTSRDVSFTGLQGYFQYNFHLLVEDGLDNPSLYRYDHIQQAFVYVSPTGNDGLANGSIYQPFRNIQPAIEYAYSAGVKQIRVSQGQYTPQGGQPLGSALKIYGDMTLSGGWNSDFTIYDPSVYVSEISGDYDNSSSISGGDALRHFDLSGGNYSGPELRPNQNTQIDGFTISYSNNNTIGGGAVLSSYPLNFTNCIFTNHFTTLTGGAIYFALSGGNQTVSLENCQFENNRADLNGGAIAINISTSTLNILDCDFRANSADQAGAIYSQGAVIARNSNFINNEASTNGGSLYLEDLTSTSQFTLSEFFDCTFSENKAHGGSGGAIYSTQLLILESTTSGLSYLKNNFSQFSGGAIYVDGFNNPPASFTEINGIVFFGNNSISEGGGLCARYANLKVSNSLFDQNISTARGGSLSLNYCIVDIFDSNDFSGNQSQVSAGAVYSFASNFSDIKNCLFTNNKALGSNQNGGALYLETNATRPSACSIVGSTFDSNSSTGFGGAVFSYGIDLTIKGSQFINSQSFDDGGAIYAEAITPGAQSLEITSPQNTFQGNVSTNGGGGAISCNQIFSYIEDTLFEDNQASSHGGALAIGSYPTTVDPLKYLRIERSIFQRNNSISYHGGAIAIMGVEYANLRNIQYLNNSAVSSGAYYIMSLSGTINDSGSLFMENTSSGTDSNGFSSSSVQVNGSGASSSYVINDGIFVRNSSNDITNAPASGAIIANHCNVSVSHSILYDNEVYGSGVENAISLLLNNNLTKDFEARVTNSILFNNNPIVPAHIKNLDQVSDGDTFLLNGMLQPDTSLSIYSSWGVISHQLPRFQGDPIGDDPRGPDGLWPSSDDTFFPQSSIGNIGQQINKGHQSHSLSSRDILGNLRSQDGQVDLGPYEVQGNLTLLDTVAPIAPSDFGPISSSGTVLRWEKGYDDLDYSDTFSNNGQLTYFIGKTTAVQGPPADAANAYAIGTDLSGNDFFVPSTYLVASNEFERVFPSGLISAGDWVFIIIKDRAGNMDLYPLEKVNP